MTSLEVRVLYSTLSTEQWLKAWLLDLIQPQAIIHAFISFSEDHPTNDDPAGPTCWATPALHL